MSSNFVYKAAAGMLVVSVAPVYCVWSLMQLGSNGSKGSFALDDRNELKWAQPEELARPRDPEQLWGFEKVTDALSPKGIASKVAAWMESGKR